MNEDFDLVGNIAYRIVVIKFDTNQVFILTFISHFIMDGVGLADLIKQKIYDKRGLTVNTFLKDKSYKDYEEERQLELNMALNEQLNNHLMHYLKHINIVKEFFDSSFNLNEKISSSYFEFSDNVINNSSCSINTILVSTLVRVLSKLHNKKDIPIKMLYNGRCFGENIYNNLLGDFHDNILINAKVSLNDSSINTINQISKQLDELRYAKVNNNNLLIESIRNNPKYITSLSFQTDITVNIVIVNNLTNEEKGDRNYLINKINSLMKKYKKSSTNGISFKVIYNAMLGKGIVHINYPSDYSILYKKIGEEFNKELRMLSNEIDKTVI